MDENYYVSYKGGKYRTFEELLASADEIDATEIVFENIEEAFLKKFGKTLKKYRAKTGIKQEELANKMGISVAKVMGHEQATRSPAYPLIYQYAAALNIKKQDLFDIDIWEPVYDFNKRFYGVAFFHDIKGEKFRTAAIAAIRGIAEADGLSFVKTDMRLKELKDFISGCSDEDTGERYTARYAANLGARLALLREMKGYTRPFVTQYTQISTATLNAIESGTRLPSYEFLFRLGFLYGKSLLEIIPRDSSVEDFERFAYNVIIFDIFSNIKDTDLLYSANEVIRAIKGSEDYLAIQNGTN